MAKTYIDTVKYIVTANFTIDGLVEKPDIIGAIFGQTEGLIGDELELRELQKNGKIGRIEVDLEAKAGKTAGKIIIPSSLDRVETVILASAIEVVDKVGPCAASVAVERVEDTRSAKRKQIVDRAKELLQKMSELDVPESQEIVESVQSQIRQAEVASYGPELLPCGPGIETQPNLIVVEGRADVLNLLRHGIKNVIATGGAKVPKSLVELSKSKTLTAFVDGDRGGDIIIRGLQDQLRLESIARAPDGKEVEELTGKEILQALRRKTESGQRGPPQQAQRMTHEVVKRPVVSVTTVNNTVPRPAPTQQPLMPPAGGQPPLNNPSPSYQALTSPQPAPQPQPSPQPAHGPKTEEEQKFEKMLSSLNGSLNAVLLDGAHATMDEVPVRKLMATLEEKEGVHAIVFDGIITNRLADLASKKNVKYLVGVKEGKIENRPPNVKILTSERPIAA